MRKLARIAGMVLGMSGICTLGAVSLLRAATPSPLSHNCDGLQCASASDCGTFCFCNTPTSTCIDNS